MEEEQDYTGQFLGEINSKVRDLEEKQKINKDRILLIGQIGRASCRERV